VNKIKVGDLVMFESDVPKSQRWRGGEYVRTGIVVAELSGDHIEAPAVSVVWQSGEFTERVPPRILEVINESR
jgi:hypothetical protein